MSTPFFDSLGTTDNPIIDCDMDYLEALIGVDPACPPFIKNQQVLISVDYCSFDGKVHRGQIVIDSRVAADICEIFAIALQNAFPIHSAIPLSHPKFRAIGRWDDDLSMQANNTSAFNYRAITGGGKLSNHALGLAIDINPLQNPYIKGAVTLPQGAQYFPDQPGTLASNGAIVNEFLSRGWKWGGDWTSLKDYQHFEKTMNDA